MSDSEHSTVTYTSVSFPVEDDSDIGSPGVDGPPIMPEDPYAYIMAAYEVPPSPDYIPGPEEPQSPPPLDFVPEPMYPEYMPQEDEILPAEEQPLPAAASPTADSPGYVPESDPEEEPEEDDEDPEEDPADYPADYHILVTPIAKWVFCKLLSVVANNDTWDPKSAYDVAPNKLLKFFPVMVAKCCGIRRPPGLRHGTLWANNIQALRPFVRLFWPLHGPHRIQSGLLGGHSELGSLPSWRYSIMGVIQVSPPSSTVLFAWISMLFQGMTSTRTFLGFAAVLAVLVTGASQSRQHVSTSSIRIESCKSPTAELFDVDSRRISIRHCVY
ncbi:hypothetical protein Tco_0629928 [Tanacetum coccineum]|uniref:Uncharacterized protein n=1 Tax=Tanacetum coccineum TaxID=301880 RepID=A0ABQ4WV75_9ASTR